MNMCMILCDTFFLQHIERPKVVSPDLFQIDFDVWWLHTFNPGVATVVLVQVIQQCRDTVGTSAVSVEVGADHLQLKRYVRFSAIRTLQEAAADAPQPHFGIAILGDAPHVVACLAKDPLNKAELIVVFETNLEDTDELLVVPNYVPPRLH